MGNKSRFPVVRRPSPRMQEKSEAAARRAASKGTRLAEAACAPGGKWFATVGERNAYKAKRRAVIKAMVPVTVVDPLASLQAGLQATAIELRT